MFNLNFFKQKSPQQRFLFILGLTMLMVYLALGVLLIFTKLIPLDGDRFPRQYQIGFGVVLIAYGLIRFMRLIKDNDTE